MEGGGGVETLHKNRGNEFIGRDMGFDKKKFRTLLFISFTMGLNYFLSIFFLAYL